MTNRLSYSQRLLDAAEIGPHQGVVFLQGPAPLEQVRVANPASVYSTLLHGGPGFHGGAGLID
jgi:hypothetical protein